MELVNKLPVCVYQHQIFTFFRLLVHYDPSFDMILASYASVYDVAVVISHVFHGDIQKVIAHGSTALTSAERNYDQIEKAALASLFAIKKCYILLCVQH